MYDILIRNSLVVDGTGENTFVADIAVKDGRIAAMGTVSGPARETVDATGRLVTPGFIDLHSHTDVSAPYYRYMQSSLMQGITTSVGGQCGYAPAPCDRYWTSQFIEMECLQRFAKVPGEIPELGPPDGMQPLLKARFGVDFDWRDYRGYVRKLQTQGIGINQMAFAGHGAIRSQVMGYDYRRAATTEEVERMGAYLEEALDAGVCGMSVGFDYAPGMFADRAELLALLRHVQARGGVFAVHWRKTGIRTAGAKRLSWLDGVREALEIALEAGVQLQISHLSSGYQVFPSDNAAIQRCAAQETIRLIDSYRARGLSVYYDVMPNNTGGILLAPDLGMSVLSYMLDCPSREAFSEKLEDAAFRQTVRDAILSGRIYDLNPMLDPEWDGNCRILSCNEEAFAGKTVREIAEQQGTDSVSVYLELLHIDPYTKAFRPMRGFHRAATETLIADLHAGVCTDAFSVDTSTLFPFCGRTDMPCFYPNPNTYNGMLHYLTQFPQQRREDTIAKITSFPAKVMRIPGRGTLRLGMCADILVFDPDTLDLNESLVDPRRYPTGMEQVIVNGVFAVKDGQLTMSLSGAFLPPSAATQAP